MLSALADRLLARAGAAMGRQGAILCLHGLTPDPEPPGSIHLATAEFRTLLDTLAATHQVVPLSDLLARDADGRSTRGLLALTFDDAYVSVASVALPELAARGMPACLFVVSGAAASGRAYWWDRMDAVWRAAPAERWSAFQRAAGLPGGEPSLRDWILRVHHGRWPDAAEPALAAAERELGLTVSDRSVSLDQLATIARQPHVEIGVHTVTHAALPTLDDAAVVREVRECHDALRAVVPRTLAVLAAPYGLGDARVVSAARSAGMQSVLSVSGATLDHRAPPGWVPRICLLAGLPAWKTGLTLGGWLNARRLREPYPSMGSHGA